MKLSAVKIKSFWMGSMSKRQISKIYPGIRHLNRKESKWFEKLLNRDKRCRACGTKKNLQPHHIIPCHVYDKLYFDINNGAILCRSCHDRYHGTCFPVNDQTFKEFCAKKHHPKSKKKKKQKYTRKKYQPHPLYSKIKINDFRKKPKKRKRLRCKKNKLKRINPIFLNGDLGTDDWNYLKQTELEKEVLGDY